MKCLILAAGYATRLYPLTENFPKPLLEVNGKPILDWLIEDIGSLADEYIVVTNHKFVRHFENWVRGRKIRIVDDGTSTNETRLGAVCDIQFALEKAGIDDDLLIIAGDNLLDFSLKSFIGYAREKNSSCTMRYYEDDMARLRKSGVVTVGEDDRILAMAEKPAEPESHWCTPPFYYYRREDLLRIPEAIGDGCGTDAPGSLVAWMCRHTVMHSMKMPGKRYDIGTLESYQEIKAHYKGLET
jgi:glucose-1-phosphate thymidylyltransferase